MEYLDTQWRLGLDYAREARDAHAKLLKLNCSLIDLTVCELASLIQTRAVTPMQSINEFFARIHERNPRLNALVLLCEARAKAIAKSQTDAIKELPPHIVLPPLAGIPFVVKDLEDVGGLATSYGSKVFAGVNVASEDSVQVSPKLAYRYQYMMTLLIVILSIVLTMAKLTLCSTNTFFVNMLCMAGCAASTSRSYRCWQKQYPNFWYKRILQKPCFRRVCIFCPV